MNLILFEPSAVAGDGTVRLSAAQAAHLLDVLKAGPGDTVRVGVIDGAMGLGTVTSVTDRCVELRCAFEAAVPERPRVDLLLALPRPKVMRRLWAPLAALGVGQILLTNAEKVERDYFGSHLLHEDTYRPLLIEGLQQARDTRLPSVSVHRRFRVLVEDDLDRLCPGRPADCGPSRKSASGQRVDCRFPFRARPRRPGARGRRPRRGLERLRADAARDARVRTGRNGPTDALDDDRLYRAPGDRARSAAGVRSCCRISPGPAS